MVEFYNSGKGPSELSSEYAISKSTITGWIKKMQPLMKKVLPDNDFFIRCLAVYFST
ncbi:helix-turn-helix domain-containing protein [Clostridium sporogenes]|nr:helix-turn-helix domain-containing protein [Clostridium sporogenes]NFS26223.1 helix-turn-helix domain-containing protein [Clostridium sporogenes]